MKQLGLAALALLFEPLEAAAQARDPEAAPTLTTTRYDEDWSVLADDAKRTGRWTERFKFIPFDESSANYVTVGLEIRARSESYRGNAWGSADAPDDGYVLTRALPYADLHIGRLRAFVQPIAAGASGVRPAAAPVDHTGVDLLQGFADLDLDVAGAGMRLRAGREIVRLGTERLVGTRYGPNVPLAFDGARATIFGDRQTIDLLYLRPVDPRPGDFDDRTSSTRWLWGVYAARTPGGSGTVGLDLYYLGYRNTRAAYDVGSGPETRHSFGIRFFGSRSEWRWNIEGVAQIGHFAGEPIRAWTFATEVGRSFPSVPLRPTVILRANVASGDRRNGRLGTFNALFPKGKYFGELSPIGPYNLINLHPGVSLDLGHGFTAGFVGIAYWRESREDGVYDVPGHLVRSGSGSGSRHVGDQLEATLEWQATPELTLASPLSAFRPGAFIRDTGPARTITMIGIESNFRF